MRASFIFWQRKPPAQPGVQLVDKVLCSELESYKRGKEINNGGSGPLKMGHFPQTPIFPK